MNNKFYIVYNEGNSIIWGTGRDADSAMLDAHRNFSHWKTTNNNFGKRPERHNTDESALVAIPCCYELFTKLNREGYSSDISWAILEDNKAYLLPSDSEIVEFLRKYRGNLSTNPCNHNVWTFSGNEEIFTGMYLNIAIAKAIEYNWQNLYKS